MTHTRQRKRFGRMQEVAPSRFLLEVSDKLYQTFEGGYRPLAEENKADMLSELRAKLEADIARQVLD